MRENEEASWRGLQDRTSLGAEGAKLLAPALCKMTGLQTLDLVRLGLCVYCAYYVCRFVGRGVDRRREGEGQVSAAHAEGEGRGCSISMAAERRRAGVSSACEGCFGV